MTPAEPIEKALREHLRIRPQERAAAALKAGEPIRLSGGEAAYAAEIAVKALAGAGLVVIPAQDLAVALLYIAGDDPIKVMPSDVLDRLFAAAGAVLPERNDHA